MDIHRVRGGRLQALIGNAGRFVGTAESSGFTARSFIRAAALSVASARRFVGAAESSMIAARRLGGNHGLVMDTDATFSRTAKGL